jgi:cobyrinic acid a,c-diamide synthase
MGTQKTEKQHNAQSGGILIAAAGSGCGKTMFTCGLLRLLLRRGYHPCAFKCGPDYIDPTFHRRVLGVASYNLDPFFLNEDMLRKLYGKHSANYDISVIEGVMGYYDGLGFSERASTCSVAEALPVPVLLLVDCKGMGSSVMAVLEGFVHHRQPGQIRAVLFNRMSSALYERAADAARTLGIVPVGFLPERKELHVESRHLGLVMADEISDFATKIDRIADVMEETVDVEAILKLAQTGQATDGIGKSCVVEMNVESERICHGAFAGETAQVCPGENDRKTALTHFGQPPLRIAVAQDEAFCFLYEDNLNFLREKGAEVVAFSPLHDEAVPDGCDALYLGGGYPELYARQLEQNHSMRKDIREKIEAGMPCIAECGGFLYLHEELETQDGSTDAATVQDNQGDITGAVVAQNNRETVSAQPKIGGSATPPQFHKMAGIIPAQALHGHRKGHFGYIEVTLEKDCLLGHRGDSFRAHEFHYWESTMKEADCFVVKPGNGSTWREGLCTKTLYAGFPHLYFYGSPKVGEHFLQAAREYHN